MNELLRRLRDALNDGNDAVLPELLEQLFDGIDETGDGPEPSPGCGAAPTPGEAEGRQPQPAEAVA